MKRFSTKIGVVARTRAPARSWHGGTAATAGHASRAAVEEALEHPRLGGAPPNQWERPSKGSNWIRFVAEDACIPVEQPVPNDAHRWQKSPSEQLNREADNIAACRRESVR